MKGTEVQDLKAQLKDINSNLKNSIKTEDGEVNELQEQSANDTAMYDEDSDKMAQMKEDQTELAKLRQLRRDVERMEKKTASVIEGQGRRIDCLEKQYKEERETRQRLESVIGNLRAYVPEKETLATKIAALQNEIDELKQKFSRSEPSILLAIS